MLLSIGFQMPVVKISVIPQVSVDYLLYNDTLNIPLIWDAKFL